jgi:hypothetical protein
MGFAALRTVEKYPHQKIVAEVLKPMVNPGWHKQNIPWVKWVASSTVGKHPLAPHDDIHLIASMGRLPVNPDGLVKFDSQRSMGKDFAKWFAIRPRQEFPGLLDGKAIFRHGSLPPGYRL